MATVVGRDRELETIASFLDSRQETPPVLVLEGEAGIGKTTLFRAAVDDAHARGFRVLTCAPADNETQLSFAALRDLLDDVFDDVAGELPPPQRRALAVTLLREEPEGAPPEADAVAVAFSTVLRLLGRRGPTLVAIDDSHWVDGASAAPLSYALRRVGSDGIAVLLARRTDEHGRLVLDRLDPERVLVVPVKPLTLGALGRLLHDRLGVAYPRPTLHRLYDVSGGNPFFALELGQALGEASTPLPPGAPFPVPETLRELVRGRLLALPDATLEALTVASALSRATIAIIGAAIGLDALSLLEPAIDAHIAFVDGNELRFAHPLFAAATYALALPAQRRDIHLRLAGVVQDVEERARHLALATEEQDEQVAGTLEAGARAAFTRGAPAAAAELTAEALRLTPTAASDDTWRRALAEADYRFAAGETEQASALLAQRIKDTPSGPRRAEILNRQARIELFASDVAGSVTMLREALREAGDDVALRGKIDEGLAWGLLLARGNLDEAVQHARSAVRLAEARGDHASLAEALAAEALTEFAAGRRWEEAMARALSLEETMLHLRVSRHPSFAHGYVLTCADELDEARAVFAELARRARLQGDESSMPSILNHQALIECRAGNWTHAAEYAEDGYERALEGGHEPTQASTLAKTALVAAFRGALEDARATASDALRIAGGPDFDAAFPRPAFARGGETALWALGFVDLCRGDPAGADAWLGPLCSALLATGIEEPGELPFLADEVEALVALERLDDAETYVERLEAWAVRLGRPSVLNAAGRCRGLLLAAHGDDAAALAALEQACAHESLPFEQARTLLALGTQQRRARQRRAARATLQRAEAIFEELGSELWADRARAELGRIGGRVASDGELTPTELRIAHLVADGKKNKEVAAMLVVAERTVESALTQIYRKLDIRSRTELARKLQQPE